MINEGLRNFKGTVEMSTDNEAFTFREQREKVKHSKKHDMQPPPHPMGGPQKLTNLMSLPFILYLYSIPHHRLVC